MSRCKGIKPEVIKEYTVEEGDGHRIQNKGFCRNVELKLPTMNIVLEFYLFELGGGGCGDWMSCWRDWEI